ncbi:hypothetical protein BC941DRAFT_446864 [Chlamydoabsidia padenii]|nr:hypothetical protein BC941DRAFT_446864 [Chlamydoabsidia padenii]
MISKVLVNRFCRHTLRHTSFPITRQHTIFGDVLFFLEHRGAQYIVVLLYQMEYG